MTLEQHIEQLVGQAVRSALARELPDRLLVEETDPDRVYSYAEAAEYLGVTEACVRERVRGGDLWTIQLGKYVKVPQRAISEYIERQRLHQRFERDQRASVLPHDTPDEIADLLNPAPPRRERVSSKKKAQRKR